MKFDAMKISNKVTGNVQLVRHSGLQTYDTATPSPPSDESCLALLPTVINNYVSINNTVTQMQIFSLNQITSFLHG